MQHAIDMVDVSDNDGIIQIHPVKEAGAKFLGIKISEGATRLDPDAHIYAQKADATGLYKVLYHLLRDSDPVAQVENYLAGAKGLGAFVPCIDYEDLSKTVDQRYHDFMGILEHKIGYRNLKYMPIAYAERMGLVTVENQLWIPEYDETLTAPRIGHWTFWQHSEFGQIAGVGGTHLDLSLFNPLRGDKDAWFRANSVTH